MGHLWYTDPQGFESKTNESLPAELRRCRMKAGTSPTPPSWVQMNRILNSLKGLYRE